MSRSTHSCGVVAVLGKILAEPSIFEGDSVLERKLLKGFLVTGA